MCKLKEIESAEKSHKLKRIMLQLEQFFTTHYEIRYNLFRGVTEICKKGEKNEKFELLDQRKINTLAIEALMADIDCLDRDVFRYLQSSKASDYHPLRHYIEHLPKWDKRDRVTTLASNLSKDPFLIKLFHYWLLGMVVQWITSSPLHGNALMPILISKQQGMKKSTFCRMLLPPDLRCYYTDEFDLNSDSNVISKLSKFALINIDEYNRMSEVKSAYLKNILQMADVNGKSLRSDGYEQKQRIAHFIGTSNYKEILSDPTGPRRFIPIELSVRIGCLRINYAQLYSQLKYEISIGKRHWLTVEEERRLTRRNAAYVRRPVEEPLFNTCFTIPRDDEKSSDIHNYSITRLYEVLRKKSPTTMRNISIINSWITLMRYAD